MIEALEDFPNNVAAFVCHGHVTKRDYDMVLIPAVEETLKRHKKIRVYYEIGTDFAGIEPGAIWEDAKVGIGHFSRWERFAVVSDVEWIKQSMKLFGFLMPAAFRVFPTAEAARARTWVAAD